MTRETLDHPTFRCEVCGHRFDWSPELAGTTITCQCLEPVTVPAQPDDGMYDMAPVPALPIQPAQIIQPGDTDAPVLSYKRPGELAIDERYSDANPLIASTWKDLVLPISIIVVGTAAQFAFEYRLTGGSIRVLPAVGSRFVADVAVMLVGIVIAARALGVTFGPVPTAILKLGAISLAPAGLVALAGLVFGGAGAPMVLGWIVGLGVYYALFWYLFELDPEDVWQTVLIVFGVRVVFGIFIGLIFG